MDNLIKVDIAVIILPDLLYVQGSALCKKPCINLLFICERQWVLKCLCFNLHRPLLWKEELTITQLVFEKLYM